MITNNAACIYILTDVGGFFNGHAQVFYCMKRMAEKEDMIATLFFTYDKNMPERLTEYSIWFSEKDGSAEIFHREKMH